MRKSSMRLKAVGDLMLGDHPVCIGHGVDSTIQKRGFKYLYENLGDSLKDADFVFGNLESTLSSSGLESSSLSSTELRGRPEYARELSAMGFTVLNVANNHAMQHGSKAFEDTVELLREAEIEVTGLADDERCQEVVLHANGCEAILLSYSLRPEKYHKGAVPYARCTPEVLLEHIREVRSRCSAPVILSLHWGEEYLNYPSSSQVELAHAVIDAGACMLIGHHPHVLQGAEEYKTGLIAYSLGNFVFDKWQRNPRESAILVAEISPEGLESWGLVPVIISRTFQPQPAVGGDLEKISRKISKYSNFVRLVGEGRDKMTDQEYARIAERAYLRFRLESYVYFITHIYKYDPRMIGESFVRFVKRRLEGKAPRGNHV
jgi:poly-gamma-glutamate synthesis protein (capsule biosynthesis protein)